MALLQIAEPSGSTKPHEHALAVGIDLGTTNSLIAVMQDGKVNIIPNEYNHELTPSIVYYPSQAEVLVGEAALPYKESDPANTIISVKRLLSKSLSDIKLSEYPYQFNVNPSEQIQIVTSSGIETPVQVSSKILAKLYSLAKQNLNSEPLGAVITVPAYFDDASRQATIQAAALAGIKVLRLLNEPTAAAIAYGLDRTSTGTCVVYDLGGGTLDVSLLNIQQGICEVIAVNGDSNLGGDDFDNALRTYLIERYSLSNLSSNDKASLYLLAKSIKESLSTKTMIEETFSTANNSVSICLSTTELAKIYAPLLDKALLPLKRVLYEANLTIEQLDDVILVGGSSKMPLIKDMISAYVKKPVLTSIDPDKAVVIGAAIHANNLVTGQSDQLLLDVIPLSLGIETYGGLVEKIIPRNSTIPVRKVQEFTTYQDGQTSMSIHVLQGERETVDACRSLGRFSLKGIPALPAGMARIHITFNVDANGVLVVSAKEKQTNLQAEVEIRPSFGLNESQILRMLQDSSANASSDIQKRKLTESTIKARALVDQVKKAMRNYPHLLTLDMSNKLHQSINKLEQALLTPDLDIAKANLTITDLTTSLNSLSDNLAAAIMDQAVTKALTGAKIEDL